MIDDNEKELGDVYMFCFDVIQHVEPYFRDNVDFVLSFLSHLLAEVESTADALPFNLSRFFRLIKLVDL